MGIPPLNYWFSILNYDICYFLVTNSVHTKPPLQKSHSQPTTSSHSEIRRHSVDSHAHSQSGQGQQHPSNQSQVGENEADFIETNCHWEECTERFETQEELVRVSTKYFHHFFNSKIL